MARASAEEWAKRVKRWKDSGLSAQEFAVKTGVNASTLSFWRWKLAAGDAGGTRSRTRAGRGRGRSGPASPAFVEMPVAALAHVAAALEILIGDDVRVRVPAGFDEATLARVMRAVGAAR
jgi:hypothetical protein